jgi:REP element-mobilizing transposase RayT
MEADNPLGSATLMTHSSEPLRSGSATVVAVAEAVDVEAIKVEVVVNHLQTLVELTSPQSLMH